MRRKEPEERIRKGFLFFPKTLLNDQTREWETRWLEFAKWREVRKHFRSGGIWWKETSWQNSH